VPPHRTPTRKRSAPIPSSPYAIPGWPGFMARRCGDWNRGSPRNCAPISAAGPRTIRPHMTRACTRVRERHLHASPYRRRAGGIAAPPRRAPCHARQSR
jgi:hypothetical protein